MIREVYAIPEGIENEQVLEILDFVGASYRVLERQNNLIGGIERVFVVVVQDDDYDLLVCLSKIFLVVPMPGEECDHDPTP